MAKLKLEIMNQFQQQQLKIKEITHHFKPLLNTQVYGVHLKTKERKKLKCQFHVLIIADCLLSIFLPNILYRLPLNQLIKKFIASPCSSSSAFYWHSKQISGPPLCPIFQAHVEVDDSPRSVIYRSIRSTKQCSKINQPTSRGHIKISPLCVPSIYKAVPPLKRGFT